MVLKFLPKLEKQQLQQQLYLKNHMISAHHIQVQIYMENRCPQFSKSIIYYTIVSSLSLKYLQIFFVGEDVVDTVYEREEHKYVAEEKDFTQPQFFVAEEVHYFTCMYTILLSLKYYSIYSCLFCQL